MDGHLASFWRFLSICVNLKIINVVIFAIYLQYSYILKDLCFCEFENKYFTAHKSNCSLPWKLMVFFNKPFASWQIFFRSISIWLHVSHAWLTFTPPWSIWKNSILLQCCSTIVIMIRGYSWCLKVCLSITFFSFSHQTDLKVKIQSFFPPFSYTPM